MRATDAEHRRIILGLYRNAPNHELLLAALRSGVTALDTAYNYSGFTGHRRLAEAAGPLLERFDVTTKIGFFPDGHDLTASRLREAALRTVNELGRVPDTLLLHNPENSPAWFTSACRTMIRLRDQGICRAWGISTWDARPLLDYPSPEPPDVLMVRCGLSVPTAVLTAAEELAASLRPGELRGMAPFGGSWADPVWSAVDPTLFMSPNRKASRIEAAFAVGFDLPRVAAVAVGTSHAEHLRHLVAATYLDVNPRAITQYRSLIHQRASVEETEGATA